MTGRNFGDGTLLRAYVEPRRAVSRLLVVACALVALAAAGPAAASAASITIDDVTPLEGNSGTTTANFVVHLSANAPSGGVTVDYTTQNGSATPPGDYTAASGTATIAANTSTAVIPVSIVRDALSEGNETFTVRLSNPSAGNTLSDNTATGTIVDDDPLPVLRVNDVSLTEGNGGARNADDVIDQITISAMNQICAPGPVPATNGSATKAAHDSAVRTPTNAPSLPTTGAILSAAIPIAVSVMVKIA